VPTYQYTCTDCGEPLEAVQSFSDPSLTVCPTCGGKLRKVYSAVGVVFKGSGFYRTDSRAGAGKTESGAKVDAGKGSGDAGTGTTKPKTDGSGSKDSGSSSSNGSSGSGSSSSGSSGSGSSSTPAAAAP
jgi:putative FmdB family regulatory protein